MKADAKLFIAFDIPMVFLKLLYRIRFGGVNAEKISGDEAVEHPDYVILWVISHSIVSNN